MQALGIAKLRVFKNASPNIIEAMNIFKDANTLVIPTIPGLR